MLNACYHQQQAEQNKRQNALAAAGSVTERPVMA
jgi:hypothetical protein